MPSIKFASPVRGTFVRRYKRFFVDVLLETGETVTAHTANTGRMTGMLAPSAPVILSYEPKPTRKLDYTLQAIQPDSVWLGANPLMANRLAKVILAHDGVTEFAGYGSIKPEAKWASGVRFDFLLDAHDDGAPPCWIEVKSVTLATDGVGSFPDAPSLRGRKHIESLMDVVRKGDKAALLFVCQRSDIQRFVPAIAVDPAYADLLVQAHSLGVSLIAVRCDVSVAGIDVSNRIPVDFVA